MLSNDSFTLTRTELELVQGPTPIQMKTLVLCGNNIHTGGRHGWDPSSALVLNPVFISMNESYRRQLSDLENLPFLISVGSLAAGTSATAAVLSRPMQRKLVALVNCQLVEEEGRARAMRAARSLGDRTVTEMILQHQNAQQLSANLWAAVRARGCQFLGPGMTFKHL